MFQVNSDAKVFFMKIYIFQSNITWKHNITCEMLDYHLIEIWTRIHVHQVPTSYEHLVQSYCQNTIFDLLVTLTLILTCAKKISV